MAFPILPILSSIGSGLSAGAGSESTTESSMESTTEGSSNIDRTEFSKKILRQLESLFGKNTLSKNMKVQTGAIKSQLRDVRTEPEFDVESFVNGIMTQANNTVGRQAAIATNLEEADTGGTQGTNSMAALLGNKIATDSAAQLAGIKADATARGTEIRQGQVDSSTANVIGLTGQLNKTFTDYLALLRGARTNQQQQTKEHTEGTSTSTTSSPFNPMEFLGGFLGGFKAPT